MRPWLATYFSSTGSWLSTSPRCSRTSRRFLLVFFFCGYFHNNGLFSSCGGRRSRSRMRTFARVSSSFSSSQATSSTSTSSTSATPLGSSVCCWTSWRCGGRRSRSRLRTSARVFVSSSSAASTTTSASSPPVEDGARARGCVLLRGSSFLSYCFGYYLNLLLILMYFGFHLFAYGTNLLLSCLLLDVVMGGWRRSRSRMRCSAWVPSSPFLRLLRQLRLLLRLGLPLLPSSCTFTSVISPRRRSKPAACTSYRSSPSSLPTSSSEAALTAHALLSAL